MYFLLKGERSCTCVLMVSILSLSTIFLLNVGLFPTVSYSYSVYSRACLMKVIPEHRSAH